MTSLKVLMVGLSAFLIGCVAASNASEVEDELRTLERARLAALVAADMDRAWELHSEDFQLFTPDGTEYTREDYLEQIRSGYLDYTLWEPGEISVRLYGDAAVLRYSSEFEVRIDGGVARSGQLRHTDVYEKRQGEWQVVWSHASGGTAG